MSIFNVNFSQMWKDLTPPKLRGPRNLAWGTSLLKPLQELRDDVLDDYADGSSYELYSTLSAYTQGQRVIYKDRGVYENLTGSTGVAPTIANQFAWRQVNSNYIGARERVKYNSQIMLYEYALNRWFQCSGIYIQNTVITNGGLLIGNTGEYSSVMSNWTTPSATYLSNVFTGVNLSCYTIFVPNATFTGLSNSFSGRTSIVRSFANKLNLGGMQYSVSGF